MSQIINSSLSLTFRTALGDAVPALGILTLVDGSNITMSGAGSNLTVGLSGTTDHSLQIGNVGGSLTSLAVGATGETLMGSTGANCGWTSSPSFGGSVTANGNIGSTTGNISSAMGWVYSGGGNLTSNDSTDTATGPYVYLKKDRLGTEVHAGDTIGQIYFVGHDAAGDVPTAKITCTTSGTIAAGRVAGDLKFYTHPDAPIVLPSEPLLRMTINPNGSLVLADAYSTAATPSGTAKVGLVDSNGLLYSLAGTSGQVLQGGTAPAFSTTTYPSTTALGDVLVASANNVIGVVNDVTNAGYVLTANVGAAPSFQAPASTTYASDAETIAGTVTNKAVAPSNLKAKLGTQTLHGLPIGASDSVAIAWTAEPTDGQILIGKTGNQPVLTTISSGNNITATAGAGTISIAVTGTTQHAVQVGGAAGQLASLAVGTTGKYLRAVTTADPAWSTLTLPDTVSKGDVLVASADNVVGSVAGATTAGYVLMANGAATAPTFQALPASGIVSVSGTANQITASTLAGAVTLSTPATFIAPGTIAATTTVTAGTNLVSTAGNLELPETSATVGQIKINSSTILHRAGSWSNIFAGQGSGNFTTTGIYNSCYGISSGTSLTNGRSNTLIGRQAGDGMTSGSYNTIIGSELAGHSISTSSYNIFIGSGAGYNATGGECIYIGSNHVTPGETNVLKIGSTDGGYTNITKAYILGIYGVTPAGTLNVALVDSNGQLGSVASLGVAQGGTGTNSLTDHGVLLGSGTGAITPTAVGATGEVLIGNTGADASWSASPTVTTMYATTFDTNVAAAGVTLSGTTLAADGSDTDINITLTPKGTGRVSTAAKINAAGISFDSGTTTLANYVGTTAWTPTLSFDGVTTGITYGSQYGNYSRIGNICFFTALIVLTSKGSSTGNLRLNLPMTAAETRATFSTLVSNVTFTGETISAYLGNTAYASVYYSGNSSEVATLIKDTECDNDFTIRFSGFYFV